MNIELLSLLLTLNAEHRLLSFHLLDLFRLFSDSLSIETTLIS